MKYVVFALLTAILISLFSGLFLLAKEEDNSPQVLKALKIRVALSIVLVVFLVVSYYLGWIGPAR